MEKGIGSEKTHFGIFWASPRISDVSGILPDVFGMSGAIKPSVPLRPRQPCLLQPTQPPISSPPRATEDFTKEKERERDRIGEGLHQD